MKTCSRWSIDAWGWALIRKEFLGLRKKMLLLWGEFSGAMCWRQCHEFGSCCHLQQWKGLGWLVDLLGWALHWCSHYNHAWPPFGEPFTQCPHLFPNSPFMLSNINFKKLQFSNSFQNSNFWNLIFKTLNFQIIFKTLNFQIIFKTLNFK